VPGGNLTVALGKIASVSIHEFNVTESPHSPAPSDTLPRFRRGAVKSKFLAPPKPTH